MEWREALGLAASYLERIGDSVNASIAYEAYVEAGAEWEGLVKAAKAYIKMYGKTKDKRFLEKAHQWLEKALLEREGPEVLYYLGITATLLGKVEEAERFLGEVEEGVLGALEVAIEERRRKLEEKGVAQLKDPFLIRLYGFLSQEVDVDVEEMKKLYREIMEENALSLKDSDSKTAALIYLLVRGGGKDEREKLASMIHKGKVDVGKMPPFTRKLVERFLRKGREKPIPFYLRKDLEELNRLGEALGKLEGNVHEKYGEIMAEIRKRIASFKKKASLVLPKAQVREILKLYITTLPIEEEEKFNLLDLL